MNCGSQLVGLKDDIHLHWFNVQMQKKPGDGYVYLPSDEIKAIIGKGEEALRELADCAPEHPKRERIRSSIEGIVDKVKASEETAMTGRQYIKMLKPMAQELILTDINKLANYIHLSGQELLADTGEYCGCNIRQVGDISSVNKGVLTYCEGALLLDSRRGYILPPGNIVEHKPGAVASHANRIEMEQGEDGYDIKLQYTESGDLNWRDRQRGVLDYLEGKGLDCEGRGNISIRCRGSLKEDEVRELAIFISQLKDVDLLPEDCIDLAFDFIHNQTEKLAELSPKEDIWNSRWHRTSDSSEVLDCTVASELPERERESREERRERRLDEQEEQLVDSITTDRADSISQGCAQNAYRDLSSAIEGTSHLEDICPEHSYGYKEKGCQSTVNEQEKANKEAATELVAKCDPGGLMAAIEVELAGLALDYALNSFITVCEEAENEACLAEISRIEQRSAAGIRPQMLPGFSREEV